MGNGLTARQLMTAAVLPTLVIGAAICFTFRWEVAGGGSDGAPILRLDRWTGNVTVCNIDREASVAAAQNHTALTLDCQAP
jgi:hypothetical protein